MHVHDDTGEAPDGLGLKLALPDEAATLALGAALARALGVLVMAGGGVIWLEGDLGAGKTTLVRGLLRALGFAGKVKSPTYTFVEPYAISRLNLYHFDFYRFDSAEEYLDGGFDEYFGQAAICLVEWPEQAAPYLPSADLSVRLEVVGDACAGAELGEGQPGRAAVLRAGSSRGAQCLSQFVPPVPPGGVSCSSWPPPV
jgi:tRNA threonylcarbamoyladenosine biosynthesis protein TsaE